MRLSPPDNRNGSRDLVTESLKRVPPSLRETLLSRFLEGLGLTEINLVFHLFKVGFS